MVDAGVSFGVGLLIGGLGLVLGWGWWSAPLVWDERRAGGRSS